MMVSAVVVPRMAFALGHEAEHPASPLRGGVRWVAGCCPEPHVVLHLLRSSVGISATKVDCIAGMFTSFAAAAVVAGAV